MRVEHRGGPSAAAFEGSIERVGSRLGVVAPRGELDSYAYPGFAAELHGVGAGDLIVDLTDVTFIDSTSLGAVAQAARRARGRGDTLTVVCSDAHIRKVIEVTGLSRMFELESSLSAAVAQVLAR